ncbi:MAG: Cof-type HAD-IIB family hydrolase [Aristaeellaceae bacterium]
MIKLLAIDMDGTCLTSRKRITDSTLSALSDAAKSGVEVVPTTGRALTCLPHQLAGCGFYRYVISSNGARVTDARTGETLHACLMPWDRALSILSACDGPGVGLTAHVDNEFLLQGHALAAMGRMVYGQDATRARTVPSLSALLEAEHAGVEELQLFFLRRGARPQVQSALKAFPACSLSYSGRYVEISDEGATKGAALAMLAKRLGVAREEIACIGDSDNDLSMFDSAGLRFAVGNAVPELKARADVVLPDNDHDGVARAIRQHLMHE